MKHRDVRGNHRESPGSKALLRRRHPLYMSGPSIVMRPDVERRKIACRSTNRAWIFSAHRTDRPAPDPLPGLENAQFLNLSNTERQPGSLEQTMLRPGGGGGGGGRQSARARSFNSAFGLAGWFAVKKPVHAEATVWLSSFRSPGRQCFWWYHTTPRRESAPWRVRNAKVPSVPTSTTSNRWGACAMPPLPRATIAQASYRDRHAHRCIAACA